MAISAPPHEQQQHNHCEHERKHQCLPNNGRTSAAHRAAIALRKRSSVAFGCAALTRRSSASTRAHRTLGTDQRVASAALKSPSSSSSLSWPAS